jgi:outer membrane immunogenic protein
MRRNLLASTALTTSTAFMAGAALGADLLPVKAPPPIPPPLFWNGCYAGVNAGGVSGRIHQDVSIPGFADFDTSGRNTGFTGGGQIGCNWQPDPNWVLGLEGDANYLSVHRSGVFSSVFKGEDTVGQQSTRLLWLGTLRLRAGFVLGGGFLYATGGLAISDANSSASAAVSDPGGPLLATYTGAKSDPRSGWTAGVGYEYAFAQWFSVKVEYLHFDLGSSTYPVSTTGGGPLPATWIASTKMSGDIVRVGVNFLLHE